MSAALVFLALYRPPQKIAFTASLKGKDSIYVANLDGTGFRQITHSPTGDEYPVWSPDGSHIAFCRTCPPVSGTDQEFANLFVVSSNGTGLKQLSNGLRFDRVPTWSQDGRRLFMQCGGAKHEAYEIRLDGKK